MITLIATLKVKEGRMDEANPENTSSCICMSGVIFFNEVLTFNRFPRDMQKRSLFC